MRTLRVARHQQHAIAGAQERTHVREGQFGRDAVSDARERVPPGQQGLHLRKRAAAMRDLVLRLFAEVGEGGFVSVGNEQRVVAEAGGSRRRMRDVSGAMSRHHVFAPFRINERNRAGEARGAVRHAFQVLEQQSVVRGGVGRLARVARAPHARRAAEGAHLESAVVRHRPCARMTRGDRPHLDERVAGEVGGGLLHVGIVRYDLVAGQNLSDFAELVDIVRGDVELHGHSDFLQSSSMGIFRVLPGMSATKRGRPSPPMRSAQARAISTARSSGTRKCEMPATGSHWNT